MKNSLFKKVVCLVVMAAMLLSVSGCSKFLANISAKEASSVLTEALDAFYSDPVEGPKSYDESYEVPSMLEQSLTFALDGVSSSNYELGEAEINKNRTVATIPVTFSKVLEVTDIPIGTVDEVSDALGDCDKNDVEISFVLKERNGNWVIEDMSELVSVFFDPYTTLIYTDENGMPTSYYQPFFDECIVDSAWFEPLMANPLDNPVINGTPEALTACVYFDRLIYLPFTANLIRGDEVIQTVDVDVDGLSIAYIEFWGLNYGRGSYTVELVYDGSVVYTSAPVTVN